jgi:Raf kinase inhibitor-like YbhB/YbcL family protein
MIRRSIGATLALGAFVVVACSSGDSSSPGGGADASASSSSGATSSGASSSSGTSGDGGAASSGGGDGGGSSGDAGEGGAGAFTLTSSAFADGGSIPVANAKCPAGAGNASPPLAWSNAPAGTQSYAVVMRDVSLAQADNYHWVIYDIPAATTSLAEGISAVATPASPAGAKQTYWSFSNEVSYQGPCPPSQHTYQLTVYSFATPTIPVPANTTSPATADAVIQANKTGSATLSGTYAQ